jgi:3-oxoacyl-[acyl-carrier-protein] synthase I
MKPVAILGCGMVTGVGLDAPSSCTAMRAALTGFDETRFTDGGDRIMGCEVPMEKPWRGLAKLARLAAPAIRECLNAAGKAKPESIPVLLCVAEKDRPGRLADIDDQLLPEVQALLGVRFHPLSRIVAHGRVGGAEAVDLARKMINEDRLTLCIVAGVDSFLVGPTVAAYVRQYRVLTQSNSNGFIPGEAGSAVLIGPSNELSPSEFRCMAIGFGQETAAIAAEEPLRADGLVEAFRALYRDGGMTLDDADYRYTDCNGEQYGFKNDRLAITRVLRKLKDRFDHLHPADSIGEIGAAVVPCMIGLALTGATKGYAPGTGVLCHCSNDEGERAAMIFRPARRERAR